MTSDITYNSAAFDATNIDSNTKKVNDIILNRSANVPKWYEIGAAEYREREAVGKLGFPAYNLLSRAGEMVIGADESSHPGSVNVQCRIIDPVPESGPRRGIFLHIHGGGLVLGSAKM